MMRRIAFLGLAVVLSAACGQLSRELTEIPAGTVLEVRFDQTLTSASNSPGDDFSAQTVDPVEIGDATVIPAGSTITGSVTDVKRAKRGAGNARLTLAFKEITLPDGYTAPLVATVSSSSASKKKRNAAIIGGSAAGGAILGKVLGKDTQDAVVGAVVGGAIGTGVVMSRDGAQVQIPAGSQTTIRLDAPLKVPA